MSWSVGYDVKWKRDIGYGVPAFCDEPGCEAVIDRGLAYVCCDSQPYGGAHGCGLYFCEKHQKISYTALLNDQDNDCLIHKKDDEGFFIAFCDHREGYIAKPDHPDWIKHKLTHPSWENWRESNPAKVLKMQAAVKGVQEIKCD